ncbi:hypothetical protein [Actinoplanes sp. L3-i22]|uniref:hypothetical protein n=1 Tax=Actinoplanes sp. L3-i22 TaxID=2836373 RepID=UPI001C77B8BC|nr:hypothetical protein [Actinoplanes sp. L3-i22]BCY06156.1 hypothetical protein L3i22_012440 [Actinoplanes sp. L3-i22]
MIPRPGDVLIVDRNASVQFGGECRLLFRVISVSNRSTYDGWAWIQGYSLNSAGDAIERREIFVRRAGLRLYRPQPGRPNVGSSK